MAWSAYRRLLQTHPIKTKAATSSFITGLSDVCLQLYEKNSNTQLVSKTCHDAVPSLQDGFQTNVNFVVPLKFSEPLDLEWSRTFTLAAVGLCYSGPVNHLWFQTLEKLVRVQHRAGAALSKLFIDQVFSVPVLISGYFVTRGLFEGKSAADIHDRLQNKLMDATLAAWQFWPAVNLISFSVVPVMYRVLFGNISAIFWNARLSSISTQRLDDAATKTVETPSGFAPRKVGEDDSSRIVQRRLRMILNQDPVGLEEEWVHQSGIPLATSGRDFVSWWDGCGTPCCMLYIDMASAAEHVRALVRHCQQCLVMKLHCQSRFSSYFRGMVGGVQLRFGQQVAFFYRGHCSQFLVDQIMDNIDSRKISLLRTLLLQNSNSSPSMFG